MFGEATSGPSGAKAPCIRHSGGTTEVVPYPKTMPSRKLFMRPVIEVLKTDDGWLTTGFGQRPRTNDKRQPFVTIYGSDKECLMSRGVSPRRPAKSGRQEGVGGRTWAAALPRKMETTRPPVSGKSKAGSGKTASRKASKTKG